MVKFECTAQFVARMDVSLGNTMSQIFVLNALKSFPSASHANPLLYVKTVCLATFSQGQHVLLAIACWIHAFLAKTAQNAASARTGITWMARQRNV